MDKGTSSIKKPTLKRGSSVVRKDKTVLGALSKKTNNHIGTIKESTLGVGFSKQNRENHTHVLGSTGTGKSKFLEALIRQDILNKGCGLCLLDPHGSLYDEILLYASHRYPNLADRIILFNPADDKNVVGFNPIYKESNKNIDYSMDMLIASCLKAWGQDDTNDTPRITRWLGNIFYLIIRNELTLLETPYLLNIKGKKERGVLLSKINNTAIINDWSVFEDAPMREKLSYIEGAANRLNKFLSSGIIRGMIGQRENTLDFRKIMDDGKILLINLNGKDKISYENTKLLGIMIVNELFRSAKLRDSKDSKLKPFYFYIDEFAQFVTKDIARSLDETRKFKLFMILAHQHLVQLKKEDEYLYASVMTNCKNKVVFGGLSVEDTDIMTHELHTEFIDLKQIKDEMYRTRLVHKEQTRETITLSETQGESSNWSNSTSSSKTDSKTQSNSTNESRSISEQTSSSDRYEQQQIGRTGYNINSGSTIGRSSGSSQSSGYGRAQTKGNSQSEGGGQSKSSGRSVSTSTGLFPYKEELELSSREFWSKDELLFMKMGEMKKQGVAEAFIKIGTKAPIRCKVQDVKQVHYSERYSPEKINKFKEAVITNNDCYTPLSEAKKAYKKRQEGLFGEALKFDDEYVSEDEKVKNRGDNSERDGKFN